MASRPNSPVWTRLREEGTAVAIKPGQVLLRPGDELSEILLVQDGVIRVYHCDAGGHQITLYRFGRGELCALGLISASSGLAFPAWAAVETGGQAVSVPVERFRRWLGEDEQVFREAFESLHARTSRLITLLAEVAFGRQDSRVAAALLARIKRGDEVSNVLAITHEEIAVDLGTAREVVSRVLKAFEREKGLHLERAQVVLNESSVSFLRRKAGLE